RSAPGSVHGGWARQRHRVRVPADVVPGGGRRMGRRALLRTSPRRPPDSGRLSDDVRGDGPVVARPQTPAGLASGQTDMIRVHSGSERRLSNVSIIGSPPLIGLALYGLSSTARAIAASASARRPILVYAPASAIQIRSYSGMRSLSSSRSRSPSSR